MRGDCPGLEPSRNQELRAEGFPAANKSNDFFRNLPRKMLCSEMRPQWSQWCMRKHSLAIMEVADSQAAQPSSQTRNKNERR
jgi:hypothetical protein